MQRTKGPKCACGCGDYAKIGNRYIHGHHARMRTGWHHTDECKEQLRKRHKGLKASQDTKDKMSASHKANPVKYWLGKHHSEERKEKTRNTVRETYKNPEIRKKCGRPQVPSEKQKMAVKQFMLNAWKDPKFKEKLIGENANNWKGGISFMPYHPTFNKQLKKDILLRDKYTCQNEYCKKITKVLAIHHINYDKQDTSIYNLITLCVSCNGRANWNRPYWQKLYTNKINDIYATNKAG